MHSRSTEGFSYQYKMFLYYNLKILHVATLGQNGNPNGTNDFGMYLTMLSKTLSIKASFGIIVVMQNVTSALVSPRSLALSLLNEF